MKTYEQFLQRPHKTAWLQKDDYEAIQQDAIESLKRRIAALENDKARLDWLVKTRAIVITTRVLQFDYPKPTDVGLREAIDCDMNNRIKYYPLGDNEPTAPDTTHD